MSANFSMTLNQKDKETVISFKGQIDEDADFSLLKLAFGSSLVFDLNDVIMINSCGIREWIKFGQTIPSNVKIIYRNCPQVIVEQMNIVKGFVRQGGVIESFYAPYFCEETDEEHKMLIAPKDVVGGKAPALKDQQGHVLDFDDIEAQYFNFLKNL